MFGDLSTGYLITVAVVLMIMLLVAFPVHEFAHALAAVRLGDGTPRLLGRLTLDPRAHFDPAGAIILAISMIAGFGIGWAKPTPYNPLNLRGGRWGEAIIAVAGPISNLILALAAAIPYRYIRASGMDVPFLENVLALFVTINLLLMVFNLIPIPPLDGSKVLYAFLDPRTGWQVRATLEQYGLLILLAAMFLPIFGGRTLISVLVTEALGPLIRLVLGV
jgi:Zn-dependent protease